MDTDFTPIGLDEPYRVIISEDPIGLRGGINKFAYVGNNPVNWIDPWGLFHCVGGANCNFTPAMNSALECFDECTGRDTAITGGRGNRNRPNSSHARGEACDIGRNSNPDLSRDNAAQCFAQCFSNGYGQEEGNGPNIPGTHFHFQLNPIREETQASAQVFNHIRRDLICCG